jgi:hypothetical protein
MRQDDSVTWLAVEWIDRLWFGIIGGSFLPSMVFGAALGSAQPLAELVDMELVHDANAI